MPDYVLNNEELSRMVDTSDEWIMTRVGIKERHILTEEGLGTSYMARKAAKQLLQKTGVDPDIRVRDISEEDHSKIRDYINENLTVEGDLHREVNQNIKRLMEIGCYRGLRHRKGLPVRGQRTHTNARTRKGPRKQIGGKKK